MPCNKHLYWTEIEQGRRKIFFSKVCIPSFSFYGGDKRTSVICRDVKRFHNGKIRYFCIVMMITPEPDFLMELYAAYLQSGIVSTDSRNIPKGSIFFCLKGERFDGNRFAQEAILKGATLVVADDAELGGKQGILVVENALSALQQLAAYHRRQFKIPVLAITGSNGKTTTKELLAGVLAGKYKTHFTQGNLNNHIGVPLTLLSMKADTQFAVIEMGANHIGEIRDLCQIAQPNYGLITNIGEAHLEGFGGKEGIRKGKGELFEYLRKHLFKTFVFSDSPDLMAMSEGMDRVLYGSTGLVQGMVVAEFPLLLISWKYKNWVKTSLQLTGSYNLPNILAAAAVGTFFGIEENMVSEKLSGYIPANMRSQKIQRGTNIILMDAYNANPSSMRSALASFRGFPTEQKVIVLGDMMELGTESQVAHTEILKMAMELNAKKIILVGENYPPQKSEELIFVKDAIEAGKVLKGFNLKNTAILIKGSRKTTLEKVLDFI